MLRHSERIPFITGEFGQPWRERRKITPSEVRLLFWKSNPPPRGAARSAHTIRFCTELAKLTEQHPKHIRALLDEAQRENWPVRGVNINMLAEARLKGATIKQLAEQFGIPRTRAQAACRQAYSDGLLPGTHPGKLNRELVWRMARQGLSSREIADYFGVAQTSVFRLIQRAPSYKRQTGWPDRLLELQRAYVAGEGNQKRMAALLGIPPEKARITIGQRMYIARRSFGPHRAEDLPKR